jgi:hypothetical protein
MKCVTLILDQLFKQYGDWKIYLMANWPHIIGNLKNHVTLEKVVNDTVILGVNDSTWMQELYMLSPVLINKINQALDKPHIKYVRFRLQTKKKTCTRQQTKQLHTTMQRHTLNYREKKALGKITDHELCDALENFLNKCYYIKTL